MDDSYGMPGVRSQRHGVEGGKETSGAWSCVDYHDGSDGARADGTWSRFLKIEKARKKRERRALSSRFVATDEYLHAREDEYGKCRAVDARGTRRDCDGTEHVGRLVGDRVGTGVDAIWYTGKQTNRGWPGTAEGKINKVWLEIW